MSNYIKSGSTIYSAVTKNTTFNVGVTGADDYGPTNQTGFYKGIIPPVGGYTIYMHKELQGPSIHVANDDNQCIFFLKSFGATGSTISEVLAWSTGRTDIWVQTAEITINDITGNTQDSLVLKLDASNPSSYSGSGNIWYDLAGTQDNITLYNTPTFTSGTPSYFTFNGSNEYGLGSNNIIPSTGYTKSVWVYLNGYQDNNIVSGDGHFMYMGPSGTSHKIYCGHSDWNNFLSYPSTSTINLNTWYNITLTFNTTDGMKLYINGVLDSTYTINKNPHPGSGTVNLATYNGGNLLNGRIAKVYCYDKSLTSDEVLNNYNLDKDEFITSTPTPTPTNTPTPEPTSTPTSTPTATPTPSGGVVMYLQSAPSSGTQWIDTSGNGNHGLLNGSTTYTSSNGGGIIMDSSNEYISISYNLPSTFTIQIVLSVNDTQHWSTLFGNESYFVRGFLAYISPNNSITFENRKAGTSVTLSSGQGFTQTNINHLTFSYGSGVLKIYVNGVLKSTNNGTSSFETSTNNLYFGARHTNAGTGYTDVCNGTYYQMKVHDTVLSDAQVTNEFDLIKNTYGL